MGRLPIHTTTTHPRHVKLATSHWFSSQTNAPRSVEGPQHRRWCYFTWPIEPPPGVSPNQHHWYRCRTCNTTHNTLIFAPKHCLQNGSGDLHIDDGVIVHGPESLGVRSVPIHTATTHLGHVKLDTIHWFSPQTTAPKECRGTWTSTMVLFYMGHRPHYGEAINPHH